MCDAAAAHPAERWQRLVVRAYRGRSRRASEWPSNGPQLAKVHIDRHGTSPVGCLRRCDV